MTKYISVFEHIMGGRNGKMMRLLMSDSLTDVETMDDFTLGRSDLRWNFLSIPKNGSDIHCALLKICKYQQQP